MIFLKRNDIPDVLQVNQHQWTVDLLGLVKKYGSYESIPESIKKNAVDKYREEDVKLALKKMSSGKCVFCESMIEIVDYPHIEHFYPKSLYPKLTFKYSNMFLSCAKCNIPKGDTDTKIELIVDPTKENPELYFRFDDAIIDVSHTSPSVYKSANTIKYCDLQRISLSRAYADMLVAFHQAQRDLRSVIDKYNSLVQYKAKINCSLSILSYLDNFKNLAREEASYAGYIRYLLNKSPLIAIAINIVNLHSHDLLVNDNYQIY